MKICKSACSSIEMGSKCFCCCKIVWKVAGQGFELNLERTDRKGNKKPFGGERVVGGADEKV